MSGFYQKYPTDAELNWITDSYSNNSSWKTQFPEIRTASAALTATTSNTIAISGLKAIPGQPIRIFDIGSPIIYGDTNGNISAVTITNMSSIHTDNRGMLYFSIIDDTNGYFHVNCYDDALKTHLVFHTASFNTVGTKTIIADSTTIRGGIFAGTITIAGALVANNSIVYQFYKYGIITAYNGTTLTLAGVALSTTTNAIKEITIGNSNLIVKVDCNIPGGFASSTLNTGFITYKLAKTYWDQSAAGHLCMLYGGVISIDSGAAQPKICMYHRGNTTVSPGSELSLSTLKANTTTEIIPNQAIVNFMDNIDLRIIRGAIGDSSNLWGNALYVLES